MQRTRLRGFTLVEVALALGLFAFAIVAVLGLFVSGMNNERQAATAQAAGSLIASLTAAIEGAVATDGGELRALPPLEDFTWDPAVGGARILALDGFSVRVEVRAADRVGGEQVALMRLSLAWPESASWDESGQAREAAGSLADQGFLFLP